MTKRAEDADVLFRRGLAAWDDAPRALRCFLGAAERGHVESMCIAGKWLAFGFGTKPKPKVAYELTTAAAALGSVEARWRLARFGLMGLGTRKNLTKAAADAVRGWRETGYARFANLAGEAFDLKRDPRRSFRWHLRGALAGNVDSMTTVGVGYRYGTGVRQDLREAVRWYRKAARRGCLHAMSNLGICHKNGEGVAKSKQRGLWWLRRAAAGGHEGARSILASIEGGDARTSRGRRKSRVSAAASGTKQPRRSRGT